MLEIVPYITSVLNASKYDMTTKTGDPDITGQLTLEVGKYVFLLALRPTSLLAANAFV
jgi:hypothetical protein